MRSKKNSWFICFSILTAVLLSVAGSGRGEPAVTEAGFDAFLSAETETARNIVFTFPVPAGMTQKDAGESKTQGGQVNWMTYRDEDGGQTVYADVTSFRHLFTIQAEQVQALYQAQAESMGTVLWQEEIILNGNHPALMLATEESAEEEDGTERIHHRIRLLYFCGSNMLNLFYEKTGETEIPDAAAVKPLLSRVSYSVPEGREGLPEWLVTLDSFVCQVEPKDGNRVIAGGKTIQCKAEPAEAKLIRTMDEKALGMAWFVLDPVAYQQNGTLQPVEAEIATITAKGLLKAGKTEEITPVMVTAYNPTSGYVSSNIILIVPEQKKLMLSEKEVTLYAGESAPLALTVTAEPESSLIFEEAYTNITWTVNRPELLEIKDGRNGTVYLNALAAGSVTVTAKDAVSGKSVKTAVKIMTPVSGVEISGPDTVQAGKSVTMKAVLTPEKPSSRKVEWSVNVGGDIAAINSEGRLTIKKDVPEGTEITVTCRATGSSKDRICEKTVVVSNP